MRKIMQKEYVTNSFAETRELGERLACELRGGEVICLEGELGAGKTTFAQGLLKGLGAEGPYTSPTFLIIKHYQKEVPNPKEIPKKSQNSKSKTQSNALHAPCSMLYDIYHIDAYRVGSDDILSLGWEEFAGRSDCITIVEWPERIEKILPEKFLSIRFESLDEGSRRVLFS